MTIKILRRGFLYLFLCAMVAFPAMLFAGEFPGLCRVSGLRLSDGVIVFFSQHTAKPRLYVIHNISNRAIWLTHEQKNPSASAGWASQLFADHWSAILVTKRNFDLQCHFQAKSGAMKTIPCKQVIQACQFSEFYSKNPIGGGYWVVENVLLRALESRIAARGISVSGEAKSRAGSLNSVSSEE